MSDKSGLYKKISAVMQDVEYLTKDDQIKFKSTNYKAISEEKVTRTVRESLIKNGLIILPINQEHSRNDTLSTVDVTYKIIDTETGESESIVSSGTGVDTQDKGVGKAMTYAYKYLLLRTFAIPTGEDPDKTASAEIDAKEQESITQEQVGLIKQSAMQFADLRGGARVDDVYKALNIQDITKLTKTQANQTLNKLGNWIKKANEQGDSNAGS